jgi:hypothetical protein
MRAAARQAAETQTACYGAINTKLLTQDTQGVQLPSPRQAGPRPARISDPRRGPLPGDRRRPESRASPTGRELK